MYLSLLGQFGPASTSGAFLCYNNPMYELEKRLASLEADFHQAYQKLAIDDKLGQIAALEQEVAEPEIWRDVATATAKNQQLSSLTDQTQPWVLLSTQIKDLRELLALADQSLEAEIAAQLTAMEDQFTELKKSLRFRGPYDDHAAIIRITSGAGGTEAMD